MIPETYVRKDWPRLVKNAIDGVLKRLAALELGGTATRLINTTAPLTGGGDLSADRTLAITAATALAAGSMSGADKAKLDAISGTNTGDQTSIVGITGSLAEFNAALTGADFATGGGTATGVNTGDQTSVTGNAGTATALQTSRNFSITGGGITAAAVGFDGTAAVVFNASVDAGHVTLARMADVATGTVFYRKTAGPGAPEVQTLATLKTDLGLTGTNSGDQTSIVGITGTLAQFNTAVTDADLAPIASPTFTGTATWATGVGTTVALGGAAIGTDKLAVTGTTTLNGKLTIVTGSGFRFRNGATDGFDVTQLNTNSWGWTGLSGGMWFNMQNTHLIVTDGRVGIRTAAGTDPTAHLEFGIAGTTALAPIRLKTASAALLTVPLSGVIETDGTDLYFTNNAGTRKKVTLV